MILGRRRRRKWRPSILVVLTVGLAGGVLAGMAAVLFVALGTAERNTSELLGRQAEALLMTLSQQVRAYLQPAEALAAYVARTVSEEQPSPQALLDMLIPARAAANQIVGVAYITTEGHAVGVGSTFAGQRRVLDEDWSERQAIRDLLASSSVPEMKPWYAVGWIGDLSLGAVVAGHPVWRDGRYQGLVVAFVSVQVLSEFVAELETGQGLTAFVLYGENQVLAHPFLAGGQRGGSEDKPLPALGDVNDAILADLLNPAAERLALIDAAQGVEGRLFERPAGEEFALFRRVPGYGEEPLIVGVHGSVTYAGDVLDRLQWAAGIGAGVLALTLAGVLLIGRSIGRPMRSLAEAARTLEQLELDKMPVLRPGIFRETALAADAFTAMGQALSRFATYVPRQLVLRLMQGGDATLRSEMRDVTVLFTDVAGFTRLATELSPEEAANLVNQHFALLGAGIEATQGTIDKYLGDGIMAFWGAPDRQADHARLAVVATRALAATVAADNAARRARGEPPLPVRFGLHTGPAIVGNVGAPGRINYTLIGDTVNTAERLQELGRKYMQPGEDAIVLLSDACVRAAGEVARPLEDLGEVVLYGHPHPTRVWRLALPGTATGNEDQSRTVPSA